MSLKNVEEFHNKIKEDYDFFCRHNEALSGTSNEERKRKIVEFAKQQGFDFSAKELQKFIELSKHSEIELEKVELTGNWLQQFFKWLSNLFQNILFYLNWFGQREFIAPKSDEQNKEKKIESSSSNPHEPKLSVNRLEQFFIWLSGSSPKILATCPDSEQRTHATLGMTLLIPTIFSIISSSFLLHVLDFSIESIAFASTIWAIIVLTMDRALVSNYRKRSFQWLSKSVILRLIIAVLMSVTVSHPVVLLFFSGTIDSVYDKNEREPKRTDLSKVENSCGKIDVKKREIESEKQELERFKQELPIACTRTNDPLQQNLTILTNSKAEYEKKSADFDKEAKRELEEGTPGCKKTKLCGPGKGGRFREAIKKGNEAKEKVKQFDKDIELLEQQIKTGNLESDKECTAARKAQGSYRESKQTEKEGYIGKLKQQLEELEKQCKSEREGVNKKQPDILKQILILDKILFGKTEIEGETRVLGIILFGVLISLFLLIDLLPIIIKFTSRGIYELKVDMVESNNELFSFIKHRLQRVAYFIKIESIEREKINSLRESVFKDELQKTLNLQRERFIEDDRKRCDAFFKSFSNTI